MAERGLAELSYSFSFGAAEKIMKGPHELEDPADVSRDFEDFDEFAVSGIIRRNADNLSKICTQFSKYSQPYQGSQVEEKCPLANTKMEKEGAEVQEVQRLISFAMSERQRDIDCDSNHPADEADSSSSQSGEASSR